jgi:hypothetical protein
LTKSVLVCSIVETQQQIISLLFYQSRASTHSISSTSDSPSLQLRQSRSAELSKPEQPGAVEETLFPFIRSPMIELLVNIYFDYCHNQPYSFFHEGNFRSCISRQEIPDHLLLAIVATTLRFSDNLMLTEDKQAVAVWALHVFAGENPADPPFCQLSAQTPLRMSLDAKVEGLSKGGRVNAEVEPKLQLTRQARDVGSCVT